jgi:hypothetical protein
MEEEKERIGFIVYSEKATVVAPESGGGVS